MQNSTAKGTYSATQVSATIQVPENHAAAMAVYILLPAACRSHKLKLKIGYCPADKYCAERSDGQPICCDDMDSFIECGAIRTVATIAPSSSGTTSNAASSALPSSSATYNDTDAHTTSPMASGSRIHHPSPSFSVVPSNGIAPVARFHRNAGVVFAGLAVWLLFGYMN